jgi:hypothetical protein
MECHPTKQVQGRSGGAEEDQSYKVRALKTMFSGCHYYVSSHFIIFALLQLLHSAVVINVTICVICCSCFLLFLTSKLVNVVPCEASQCIRHI